MAPKAKTPKPKAPPAAVVALKADVAAHALALKDQIVILQTAKESGPTDAGLQASIDTLAEIQSGLATLGIS